MFLVLVGGGGHNLGVHRITHQPRRQQREGHQEEPQEVRGSEGRGEKQGQGQDEGEDDAELAAKQQVETVPQGDNMVPCLQWRDLYLKFC